MELHYFGLVLLTSPIVHVLVVICGEQGFKLVICMQWKPDLLDRIAQEMPEMRPSSPYSSSRSYSPALSDEVSDQQGAICMISSRNNIDDATCCTSTIVQACARVSQVVVVQWYELVAALQPIMTPSSVLHWCIGIALPPTQTSVPLKLRKYPVYTFMMAV